jgi:hypothetical protein
MSKPLVPTCIECGCTESQACPGGCSWIELDKDTNVGLCSKCVLDIAARDDVQLITPRWSERPNADDLFEPTGYVERDGEEWILYLFIDCEPYRMPVHAGEPEGEVVDVAPGTKGWAEMKRYGLSRLGPGVWRLTPSLWAPGVLHAFIVLCDVPEPAPFAKPLLFSASGERLGR